MCVPLKHFSSHLVENLQKAEEDVQEKTMKVMKILQYVQGHVSTTKDMEQNHSVAWDEPHVSVGGMLGVGKDWENSFRIIPKDKKE